VIVETAESQGLQKVLGCPPLSARMSLCQLKIVRRLLGQVSGNPPLLVKSLAENKTVQDLE
jgi:hypothetical protein